MLKRITTILTTYLISVLCEFKWYRKKKGGKWHKAYFKGSDQGWGGVTYWVNHEPDKGIYEVVATEVYPGQVIPLNDSIC